MYRRTFGVSVLGLLALLGSPAEAVAHRIDMFAHVHGTTIHGEVVAEGEVPVADAMVTAYSPTGEKLAETTTDEQGKFTLPVTRRCDWRLVADGDGHRALFTVSQDELPAHLPDVAGEGGQPASQEGGATEPLPEAGQQHAEDTPTTAAADVAPGSEAELSRQIVALRRDLAQMRRQLRWQDLVGGVGYILGMIGIAAYFLGGRRRAP